MSDFFKLISTIIALIVTVAIVALILSPKSKTASVIQAAGSALGNNLGVAEAPVTGANYQVTLAYPSDNPWASSPFMG